MQGTEQRIMAGRPGVVLARPRASIKTRVLSTLAERMCGRTVHWSLPVCIGLRQRQAPRALARIDEVAEDKKETDAQLESLKAALDCRNKARRTPPADRLSYKDLGCFAPGPCCQGARRSHTCANGQYM